jgi:hypothetical protein|tara:strand:- start:770 stop:1198 length:429 start_codon:yes stop_codon:yes gene_type:complete
MSSLDINNLYDKINERNTKRLEKFDDILKKIHNRILYNANIEKTYCFFQIPEFIIGVPLYNVEDLKNYLITSLKKDNFKLIYIDPNWLFISWELNNLKKPKEKTKVKKKGDYKLIDEYKPSGNFIYNEGDLRSIEQKSKGLI